MTLEEYLAHPGLSAGSISRFLGGATDVWKYDRDHGKDVEVNDDNLGNIVHACVLEGKVPDDICRVWRGGLTKKGEPTMNKNSHAYQDFVEQAAADRIMVCDEETIGMSDAMIEALIRHELAFQLLWKLEGEPEVDMVWTERGQLAKARADRLLRERRIMVELKTTFASTFGEHEKQAAGLGYHHKQDWYRRGFLGTYGDPLLQFLFVTVSKVPPHPVWVWAMDSYAECAASAEIDWALDRIAENIITGDWRQEKSKQIQYAELPQWKITPVGAEAVRAMMAGEVQGR